VAVDTTQLQLQAVTFPVLRLANRFTDQCLGRVPLRALDASTWHPANRAGPASSSPTTA
jgi:hypothetical protein